MKMRASCVYDDQKERHIVPGYVRLNCNRHRSVCAAIINIIFDFYLNTIKSIILNKYEQLSLLHLLFKQFTTQKGKGNINNVHARLVFRASEHGFDKWKFLEYCTSKGPTITIIHNEHNHVFGAYTSKSWIDGANMTYIEDPDMFLFTIRPYIRCIDTRNPGQKDDPVLQAVGGPMFGHGVDIEISHEAHKDIWNACVCNKRSSFKFDPALMSGVRARIDGYGSTSRFAVKEYEVFAVST
eukprot:145245_1